MADRVTLVSLRYAGVQVFEVGQHTLLIVMEILQSHRMTHNGSLKKLGPGFLLLFFFFPIKPWKLFTHGFVDYESYHSNPLPPDDARS